MNILRTKVGDAQYKKWQAEHVDFKTEHEYKPGTRDIIVAEYTHWFIIKNNFPYDFVAVQHDLLVPKRVFGKLSEANIDELAEYEHIIEELDTSETYDATIINFSKNRSIRKHLHIHLLTWKGIYEGS